MSGAERAAKRQRAREMAQFWRDCWAQDKAMSDEMRRTPQRKLVDLTFEQVKALYPNEKWEADTIDPTG